MARAFVFPGQGAQSVGMGSALADAYPAAREVFEQVDDALGEKLSRLIHEGPQEQLTLTANAQPALMATSLAAMAALRSEGVTVEQAACVAGHSLGEYAALAAAGALDVADTARLLRLRGQAMQEVDAIAAAAGGIERAMDACTGNGCAIGDIRDATADAMGGPYRECETQLPALAGAVADGERSRDRGVGGTRGIDIHHDAGGLALGPARNLG